MKTRMRSVLLADRDTESISDLTRLLKSNHCKVEIAETHDSAARMITLGNFDYYFIRMGQWGLYLLDLLYKVKDDPVIIALSDGSDFRVEQEARAMGIRFFLIRPYTGEEIQRLVSSH